MALTRRMLTDMGIEAEKIDQIIEAHAETTEGLKKQAEELREQASKVPALEKEIEDMKAAQPKEDWEAKYNEKAAELDEFKSKVAEEKAKAEKAALYRAALREVGVGEKFIDDIMRVADLSSVTVEDGKIADAEQLKASIADKYSTFVTQTATQGARVDEPPTNAGGKMSRDEIMAIKDTSARQKAIAENIDQFR